MTYVWLAFAAGILGTVGAAYFYGRSAGRAKAENKVLAKTADVQHAQLEVANQAPKGKEAVLERLRTGGGL
jgi:hypothetical protein